MSAKFLTLLVGVAVFSLSGIFTHAADVPADGAGDAVGAPDDFEKKLQDYLRAKFKGEGGAYYGATVYLMPGHEYLKPEHGIAEDGDRRKGASATREQMLKADRSDALKVPPERIDKLFEIMEVTIVKIVNDEGYVIEGADGEGEMKMPSKTGDVVAVARFKGMKDFLAFLMRPGGDGGWKVAAEYSISLLPNKGEIDWHRLADARVGRFRG